MIKFKSLLVFFVSVFTACFIYGMVTHNVEAASYDLIAPTGTLTRGQDVQFTINIDTQGQSLTDASIGMTYQTEPLQYVSTTPGNTFQTVSAQTQDGGKIIFTASNPSGFSGTGTFAVVTFKIIATAPGSTELCVLFNPETPTQPSTPTVPTALPKTGSMNQTNQGVFLGITLLALASGALLFFNYKPYRKPHHSQTHRKTLH